MRESESLAAVPVARVVTAEPSWLVRYTRSYPGRPDQVRLVRRFLREVLADWPRCDDAIAIASELAANCVVHSRSGAPGGVFTVRAEVNSQGTYIAVKDGGGPWDLAAFAIQPQHGLDMVEAIASHEHWGVVASSSSHLVWARLPWPGTIDQPLLEAPLSPADEAAIRAALDTLSTALAARGLASRILTPDGRLPYLEAWDGDRPEPPERVYAQAGWYYWPTAERIAATSDSGTAAGTITTVVRSRAAVPDRG